MLMRAVLARSLPRVIDSARFPNNCDLDLPRVLQAFLDLLRDITGQVDAPQIVDRIRLDHHPNLAASLDGEGALDPRERCRDCLERFETFEGTGKQLSVSAGYFLRF